MDTTHPLCVFSQPLLLRTSFPPSMVHIIFLREHSRCSGQKRRIYFVSGNLTTSVAAGPLDRLRRDLSQVSEEVSFCCVASALSFGTVLPLQGHLFLCGHQKRCQSRSQRTEEDYGDEPSTVTWFHAVSLIFCLASEIYFTRRWERTWNKIDLGWANIWQCSVGNNHLSWEISTPGDIDGTKNILLNPQSQSI